MKTLTKVLLTALLGVSLLQAAAFEKEMREQGVKVMLSSEKPLSTGNNKMKLFVSGEEFKDSEVSIKVFMPAMPGMPFMQSQSDALEVEDGEYEANVNLSMGGTWQVHIFITPKNGKKVRVKTSLNI